MKFGQSYIIYSLHIFRHLVSVCVTNNHQHSRLFILLIKLNLLHLGQGFFQIQGIQYLCKYRFSSQKHITTNASFDSFHTVCKWKSTKFTLKALDTVEDILSRNKPPANVPTIPQTIVMPPNNKSTLFCQKNVVKEAHFLEGLG